MTEQEKQAQEQVKKFKDMLDKAETEISTKVTKLLDDRKGEHGKEIGTLKDELASIKNSQEALIKQLKTSAGLPGFTDDPNKQEMSIGKIARAICEWRTNNVPKEKMWEKANAEYEKEVIDAWTEKRQKETGVTRDAIADDGSQGGVLIPPEAPADVVGLALANMPLTNGQLPVTVLPGLRGELPIPVLTSRGSAGHKTETATSTKANFAWDQYVMRPKYASVYTIQSKKLLWQSSGVSDRIIRRELSNTLGLEVHRGALNGLGTEKEPKGLLRFTGDFTPAVAVGNDFVGTGNGGRFTVTHAEQMKSALAEVDEGNFPETQYGFLFKPAVKTGMKTERIEQFSGQGVQKGQPVMVMGLPLIPDNTLTELIGTFASTSQLPATTTGTSSTTSTVVYGNWEFFYIGFWEGFRMDVSTQASDGTVHAFVQDQIFIKADLDYDCVVVRPTAFTFTDEAEANRANF